MSSYHLPIVVGHDRSERVVIVHLVDNDEKYEENRVIITPACGSNIPLFRISKDAKLICDDGSTVKITHSVSNDLKNKEAMLAVYIENDNNIKKLDNIEEDLLNSVNEGKKYIVTNTFQIVDKNNMNNYTLENCLSSDIFDGAKKGDYPAGTCIMVMRKGTDKKPEYKFKIDNNNILKNSFYEYKVRNGNFDGEIIFNAIVKTGDDKTSFTGKIHIVRAASNKVVRINADLGSDATQINYFMQQSGVGNQGINIVEKLCDAYDSDRKYGELSHPKNGKPLYLQQEAGNGDFYKTGNITFKNDGNINKTITDGDAFINYLNVSAAGKNVSDNSGKGAETWVKEQGFNKKLINIKMLYSHLDINTVKDTVKDIKFIKENGQTGSVTNKADLLQVLRSIYKQLITISTNNNLGNCKLVSVLLLVPNIYVQQNIDSLLYELNKLNNNDTGIKYDFRIISESDSAFVGIKEVKKRGASNTILSSLINKVKDPLQKDVFLIIDAGKGTTDFSIIKYDSAFDSVASNKIISLKRGGIVGAGSTIDYVFARVFARQVYNHFKEVSSIDKEVFVLRFMNMIQKLAPVDQDIMMQYVELLKKTYKEEKCGKKESFGNVAQVCTCFDGGNAKNIIANLLQAEFGEDVYNNIATGSDEGWKEVTSWTWDKKSYEKTEKVDKKEVDWVCNAIAGTIVNNMIFTDPEDVINKTIDYVIFTGRSFLFEPLKKTFLNKIEDFRGVYRENWDNIIMFKIDKIRRKNDLKNLKDAKLEGFNMKSVSVRFSEHDLGVNCNSDLCCMDSIKLDNGEAFFQTEFWKGFDVLDKENTKTTRKHYYIGYNDTSFVPYLEQSQNDVEETDSIRTKLVQMTLFPISYVPIKFN